MPGTAVGIGYDCHAFADGRPLILGGVRIDHPRDSDLTRLISGLERDGLVARQTDADDRRRSINRITAAGRTVLSRLDRDVAQAAKRTMGHLGRKRLTALLDLLVAFAPPPPPPSLS